ncbi:MAG: hypothetical protein RL273_574, partial [Bacteroidota bacterium]
MKLFYLFFFIFFFNFFFFGQSIQVHYTLLNNTSLQKNKDFKPFEIKKIEELNSILENNKNQWFEKGYYLASFKPLYISPTEIEVLVEIGSHFPNVAIVIHDSIKSQLRSFGIENISKNALKTSPSLFK